MRKKKITTSYVIIMVILVLATLLCFYPIWYTLITSMSQKEYVEGGMVWAVPMGFNLRSYMKILEDEIFFGSVWVSVKRVLVGCTLNMILLIITSYPLCLPYEKFPSGRFLKWFFFANMLFSGGMIPSYVIMKQYGLFNSFWSMILPGALPIGNIILMINFFKNVPYELHESAAMDGANPFQILFRIYVPLSIPSLACLLLFQFVGHWNSYFDGLIYINDPVKQPLQTYIYGMSFKIDFTTMTSEQIVEMLKTSDKTLNAAKVFVSLVPILCVYPFIQKYFTTGMRLGALKG